VTFIDKNMCNKNCVKFCTPVIATCRAILSLVCVELRRLQLMYSAMQCRY
jgi:hypothetical protein